MGAPQGGKSGKRTTGLVAGPGGFAAVLLAPWLVRLPEAVLFWGAVAALIAATALLLSARSKSSASSGGAYRRRVFSTAFICLALAFFCAPYLSGMEGPARRVMAVTVLMAVWWITEAIPIPATSLLPLVFFPILGVLPAGRVAASYANNPIFLFMGGFILALGIQRWNLHRRLALHIVRRLGTDPSRMVLGFMIATAFLSMWISNTATTLMMLPIGIAVIVSLHEEGEPEQPNGFAPALMLGIAYSASIGGLATPIGTPPNISLLRIREILFENAPQITFGQWSLAFLPIVVVFLPIAWLLLTRVSHRLPRKTNSSGRDVIARELRLLGPMGGAERRIAWVFSATALLWITRGDLDLGWLRIPGWAGLLERFIGVPFEASYLHDATVAMAMALLTFLLPGDPDSSGRKQTLMDWKTAVQLPWGILLLFGGGFALALAFKESGLSQYVANSFVGYVAELPPLLLVASVCLLLTFLTEVTSNTATTEVVLPVLAGTAGAIGVHPMLLMLPATLSASCAFMLPIATPPNAIVFGSGKIEMRQMVRAGILLNLVGVFVITLVFYFVSSRILGIDPTTIPDWAR